MPSRQVVTGGRAARLLWIALPALGAAACGTDNQALPAVFVDAAAEVDLGPGDLSGIAEDLADLAHRPRAAVGQPCASDDDCAAGPWGGLPTGRCRHEAPSGACATPCRLAGVDPFSGETSDCGALGLTCLDLDGTGVVGACVVTCGTVAGCRLEFGCATRGPVGACLALATNPCDPLDDPRRGGHACLGGDRCFPDSPDDSYGVCGVGCDALAQDCGRPDMGLLGCLASDPVSGLGRCLPVAGRPEGRACGAATDCAPGLACAAGFCRQYCRASGLHPVACPPGQGCGAVPGARYPASVLGLCSP